MKDALYVFGCILSLFSIGLFLIDPLWVGVAFILGIILIGISLSIKEKKE